MNSTCLIRPIGRFRCFNGPAKSAPANWFTIKNQSSDGPVEIYIYEQIGRDFWSDEGIEAKAFSDALKEIPKTRDIKLRINSPGGNVHDGLAIYNLLAERRDKVVTVVDGVAASIASVIALAGRELQMPRNALLMIHDPWGFVQGTAEDMDAAAEMLRKHRDSIASVYERKTSLSASDIKRLMRDETWMTGDDAKSQGFADTVTDQIVIQAKFDLSRFKNVPKSQLITDALSAASGGQPKQTEDTLMNRAQIIALLIEHGVTVDENSTDEQLLAALKTKLAEPKPQPPQTHTPAAAAPSGPSVPSVPQGQNGPSSNADVLLLLQRDLDEMKKARDQDRRQRIEDAVDHCIAEDRIPAAQRSTWIKRALGDETVLDDIRAMPARPPGFPSIGIAITGESPQDIVRGLMDLRSPLNSWRRGNNVSMETLAQNAKQTAVEIAKHRQKLNVVLNANTVDADLKRNVILNDLMRAFQRKLLMLNVFSTTYNNVPLEGTDKITVPFYALDTTASSDYVAATGYTFADDTDAGSRTITINKRKFQSMNFTSATFRRQPYFNPAQSLQMKVEQLAVDVWTDILSIIKADHYGASVMDVEAGAFDTDSLITLRKVANNNDWPTIGRAAVLSTDHEAALLADDAIKHFQNSGSPEALREGSTGRLFGFDMFYSPRIPNNSEDLAGFICLPQSALVATAPIAPAPGVRNRLLSYDLVVDPQTGIAFEYRYWDDADKDTDREIVECNYGYAKGNAAALKRITAGAAEFSSSSSASSVNSSSSSSSSPSF